MQLAHQVAGTGVIVQNSTFAGCADFHKGIYGGNSKLNSNGIVLSNGYVSNLVGVAAGNCDSPGYAPLDDVAASAIASGKRTSAQPSAPTTIDASVLTIEFDCQGDSPVYDVKVDYIFASNEYMGLKENEDAEFNDLAAIFLNGETPADNIAKVDGKFVSVNTIPVGSPFHIDYASNMNGAPYFVGSSVLLQGLGKTTTKTGNVIHIAVADTQDKHFNSYLFVTSLTCTPGEAGAPTVSPSNFPTQAPAVSVPPSPSPSTSEWPTYAEVDTFQIDSTNNPAMELAEKIKGFRVRIMGAHLINEACEGTSTGTFSGGFETIGFDSGVVLSTGHATSIEDGVPGDCNNKGYPPLEYVGATKDATVLMIEFECVDIDEVGSVTVDYVFASNEYYGLASNQVTKHNDVVGLFLNGEDPEDNIATVHDGQDVVSVNTITGYDPLFVNNTDNRTPNVAGYTARLTAKGMSNRQTHNLRIAIADVYDDSFDSYVLVREGSLKCHKAGETRPPVAAPTTSEDSQDTSTPPPVSMELCRTEDSRCKSSDECCAGVCSGTKKKRFKCKSCAAIKDICKRDSDCCSAECDKKSNKCVKATSTKSSCANRGKKCDKDKECCSGSCDGKKNKCE
jgi:hypothetical protein